MACNAGRYPSSHCAKKPVSKSSQKMTAGSEQTRSAAMTGHVATVARNKTPNRGLHERIVTRLQSNPSDPVHQTWHISRFVATDHQPMIRRLGCPICITHSGGLIIANMIVHLSH